MPINLENKIILIEAVFFGKRDKKSIKMVFDTGASITTIPKEVALLIGCDPVKSTKKIEIITASGTEYVPLVLIPKIELLGFTMNNVEVACLDLPSQSIASGLLGLNILRSFDVFLGFRSKFLELSK